MREARRLEMIHASAIKDVVNCRACHLDKAKAAVLERIDSLIAGHHDGDILVIRLPKKGGPTSDAEFLRRVCLDLAGRTPTLLEMHYFLKDGDPDKHRKVVEKLLEQPVMQIQIQNKIVLPPAKPAKPLDKTTRAEEYVKEKLGKKQLSADERQLLLKALEFADKDRPGAAPPSDPFRPWFEVAPKALNPPKEQPK